MPKIGELQFTYVQYIVAKCNNLPLKFNEENLTTKCFRDLLYT